MSFFSTKAVISLLLLWFNGCCYVILPFCHRCLFGLWNTLFFRWHSTLMNTFSRLIFIWLSLLLCCYCRYHCTSCFLLFSALVYGNFISFIFFSKCRFFSSSSLLLCRQFACLCLCCFLNPPIRVRSSSVVFVCLSFVISQSFDLLSSFTNLYRPRFSSSTLNIHSYVLIKFDSFSPFCTSLSLFCISLLVCLFSLTTALLLVHFLSWSADLYSLLRIHELVFHSFAFTRTSNMTRYLHVCLRRATGLS